MLSEALLKRERKCTKRDRAANLIVPPCLTVALSQHPVLDAMRRAYVRTTDDHTWSGSNRALGYFCLTSAPLGQIEVIA